MEAYDTSKCLDFLNKPQTQGFLNVMGSHFYSNFVLSLILSCHGFPFYSPVILPCTPPHSHTKIGTDDIGKL